MYSDEIPIGVSAQNVNWDNSHNLKQILGNIDIDKGTVQEQIDNIASSFVIDSELSDTSQYPVQNKIIKQALDTKADIEKIPSKLSDLRNDSGFITQAPVTSVNGHTGAVIIDLSKVDELENRVIALENISDDDDDISKIKIEIDSELSNNSLNPVQNKVIKQALDQLDNQFHNISERMNGEETTLTRQGFILNNYGKRIAYLETNPFGGDGQGGTVPIIVDSELSNISINPVQNKIIKQALDNKANIEDIPIKTSDLDNDSNFLTQAPVVSVNGKTGAVIVSEFSVSERDMLNNHQSRITSLENSVIDDITIDSELSNSSLNPVQNKVIKQALDNKIDLQMLNTKADITDIPSNLSDLNNDLNLSTISINEQTNTMVIS